MVFRNLKKKLKPRSSDNFYSYMTEVDCSNTIRLHNSKIHPLPPNLGSKPIVIDKSKIFPIPRKVLSTAAEKKYHDALLKSWRKTHILLRMDPDTPPPFTVRNDPIKDAQYSEVAVLGAVYYIQQMRFFFIQPIVIQQPHGFAAMFPDVNCPVFEIVDDVGRRVMFVAETLELLSHKVLVKRWCCLCCRGYRRSDLAAFDRTIQPYELSIMGPDGLGMMHVSRCNTHDITVTDFYNDICYIVRTDNGKFPRHYNIVDAKREVKLCELGPPVKPDDEILGNFDVFIDGKVIGKIRQGDWMTAHNQGKNPWRTRYGLHVVPELEPHLKAFLLVAVLNAYFTFNVTIEPKDKGNDDVKICNAEVWKSVYPQPDTSDPVAMDAFRLDHALRFWNHWYEHPEGVRRLSTGSLEIDPNVFFTEYMEKIYPFKYRGDKDVLPYYKTYKESDKIVKNLFHNTGNNIEILKHD